MIIRRSNEDEIRFIQSLFASDIPHEARFNELNRALEPHPNVFTLEDFFGITSNEIGMIRIDILESNLRVLAQKYHDGFVQSIAEFRAGKRFEPQFNDLLAEHAIYVNPDLANKYLQLKLDDLKKGTAPARNMEMLNRTFYNTIHDFGEVRNAFRVKARVDFSSCPTGIAEEDRNGLQDYCRNQLSLDPQAVTDLELVVHLPYKGGVHDNTDTLKFREYTPQPDVKGSHLVVRLENKTYTFLPNEVTSIELAEVGDADYSPLYSKLNFVKAPSFLEHTLGYFRFSEIGPGEFLAAIREAATALGRNNVRAPGKELFRIKEDGTVAGYVAYDGVVYDCPDAMHVKLPKDITGDPIDTSKLGLRESAAAYVVLCKQGKVEAPGKVKDSIHILQPGRARSLLYTELQVNKRIFLDLQRMDYQS